MNLYQLTTNQSMLITRLEDADFDSQTIADTLEGEGQELAEKRLAYVAIIKNKRATATAREKVLDDIRDLIESDLRTIERLQYALIASMQATGDKELIGLQFEAHIQKNPPSVVVDNAFALPREFWRTPEPKPPVAAPDKAAIKAALQAGADVPGCKLTQSVRLVVK